MLPLKPLAFAMPDRPREISPGELDEVVARASEEHWQQLALLGPKFAPYTDLLLRQGWSAQRLYPAPRLERA
jgi:hypothetical protein